MQIYVAAAAAQTGVPGIVYTAARKQRTEATGYALRMGAEVVEVRPAYLSVCRSRAKARAGTLERYVQWNPLLAIKDAADQCRNIPQDTRRIIVPTGSGLTAAGVLAGIAQYTTPGSMPRVVAIAVSDLADASDIINKAAKATPMPLPVLELIRAPGKYEAWVAAILPDGTPLDPYYAAKALAYMQPGDCLWVPGRRPLSAMPVKCQDSIKRLQDEHAT
jgi:1-aminocyclopropane-1-carboxylate deaminase/D-cysteine desulfhydrase-like pyridoxal-dependent ACC family enzyme